ncbi:hypothetical protein NEMBOFW57_006256 [Staphylotrichum longicolle]|uniref:PNPLA domain-containing protein n=1 Tax=Staphylotrichum longicolle TaxID=669026 RepID=A0AAD4HWM6_9PEZI|nr:hypothetical protein NEMBOFW57_006256 [Staphylotrichum longicolle]
MPAGDLRLLALDGGGVRGLSSLMILQQLMTTVDPESPPKPCDYFDMIGGTSTGGLIAIMLGRLQMTIDECIDAYTSLFDKVFEKKCHRVNVRGKLQGRFDTAELEQAIKKILVDRGFGEDALLKDSPGTVCLRSYGSPRGGAHLLNYTKIWQACRATSAATTFFDPIAIGPFDEEFVDGALGANNPVYALWNQAQDVWGVQLGGSLRCFVSVGTGVPTLKPVRDDVFGIWATLQELATETQKTAEQFRRDKSDLDNEGRYYRFDVDRGLEGVGLEESKKKKEIAAATLLYIESQAVFKQMKACANAIARREYFGPYRTLFALQGAPTSSHFVDRQPDTDELERCLIPRSRSPRTQQRIFLLYGLGGIGKTQLAADFARRHKATFSSVFWLDGRSEDRLRQSLAGYASKIPKGQIPDISRDSVLDSEKDVDIVVADVLDWLGRPDNVDWLLIFDNVDQDLEQGSETGAYDVRRYLPGDHGSVLITTRLSRLAQLGDSRRLRKVDKELSEAIFKRWYGPELVMDDAVTELLGLLDGLPLALAQAASYLRETELDTATYVRLYKEQWDDVMRSDGESGSALLDYEQRSIATAWTISFRAIEGRNASAANLLRLWAFLDNKDLWYGLLQQAVSGGRGWPGWIGGVACNEVKFLDAARLLLRYSMIEAQESVLNSYVMHPVVHKWTSHIQDGGEKVEYVRLAVMLIGFSVPRNTTDAYWTLQRRLLPHAEQCSRWMGQIFDSEWSGEEVLVDAIQMLGALYADQGRLEEAEAMYNRALQGKEKALGRDHTSTLNTVNNLGALYADQGRLAEAEAMYNRALQGYEKALGRDHTSTLNTVNNLGNLYVGQGRLEEAEAKYQRALQGYEKALRRDHTSTLNTVNNLGNLYRQQGRLEEAEAMYQRALEGYEKTLGRDHTSTLSTVNNLGNLYVGQGRLEEAEAMHQRALEGFEKALGRDHTSTLNMVNSLGLLYMDQRRLAEAEAMYQRALQGLEKALGRDHMSTLGTVNNLGLLYVDQGRLPEAEAMYQRALQGFEKALGRDHTSTLNTVNNLGNLYVNQGRLPEAEAMYQRALQGLEKALGRDHMSTLGTVNNLGLLYVDQGRLPEAEAMYQRALQGKEKALGRDHTSTLDTVNNLGLLCADQGRLAEAEAMYKRALQGEEKALGRDHTSTLSTVSNLGNVYRQQGRLEEAEAMYQRALQGKEKALGRDHTSTLDTVNNFGALYRQQGRLEEAEAMYQRALQGHEKALGRDHTSTLDTVNNLGLLYVDQGRLPEAEAMYQRALEGFEKALGRDHTSTLNTVNNLGNLYRQQGRLEEAEAMYQRALQGHEKALGRDHTSTLNTVNNLGNLYRQQGRLEKAEAMYQRALQGKEKALGRDHTSTLNTVNNLGALYADQGRLAEAEAMYQRALQGFEKALGRDHMSTLGTVNNLGALYVRQGRLEEAEEIPHFSS